MADFCLTNRAVEDLADIWNYTFDEWSQRQADDYYRMLLSSCRTIAAGGGALGRRYDEVSEGLRGFKAGRHIIFYRTGQTGVVEIIRILHERMDLPRRMNG